MTAVNEDLIHTWEKGIVSRRYNRSSNKCRGNFFPPEPKEAHLPRRGLFPEPTFHRAGVGLGLDQSAHAPAHRPAHRRTAQLPDHATLRAKECAGLALRYKEDSQQLDRKSLRCFRANDFSETGPGRSGLAWPHSLARAGAHRPKHQRRESVPQEIPQRD